MTRKYVYSFQISRGKMLHTCMSTNFSNPSSTRGSREQMIRKARQNEGTEKRIREKEKNQEKNEHERDSKRFLRSLEFQIKSLKYIYI